MKDEAMRPEDVRAVVRAILESHRAKPNKPAEEPAAEPDASKIDFTNFRHCWHCKRRAATQEALCHECYADRGLRRFYQRIYAKWKTTPGRRPPESVGLPTSALPGSIAKLKVFADRLALGLPLFIPGDATHYD